MLYILDRSEKVVGLLHTGTDRGSTNVYFDDLHTEDLATGAETLSFSSLVDRKTSSYLSVGNYIAFKKGNTFRMMQIIETEEEKEDVLVKDIYCETVGLELRNSVCNSTSMHDVDVKRFLDNVLQSTHWKVGYIDSSLTDSLALEIESKEVYSLIQEHMPSFGAEIRFRVEIKNNVVVGRYIDAFSQRGRNDGRRLEIHRDITKIVRKIDLSNYATKLIGVGKDGLTFKDIKDDSLNKPLGQDFITNEEAFQQINYKGEHITRKFEYDTFSPYDLLKQTKKALDEVSKPQVTYEIDSNLMNFDNVEIGDSLVVSDTSFEPPLTLVARIGVLETSNSDITKNKATLTNFRKVASGLSMLPIGGNDIINGAIGSDHIGQGQISNEHINDVSADKLTAGRIDAQIIDVVNLNASNITSGTINAGQIDVINLNADHINSGTIDAQKIDVVNLNADNIVTGKLHGDLITANTIGAGHIMAGSISAGSQIVANGAIGSAQISSLSADKLDAGTIDTAKISVAGANNHLWLRGNRIQVFEGTGTQAKERVSMGDVNGDGTKYGLRVRGADGKTILLDENGVTSEGITNGAITDDKVAGNANIHGTKLDIDSVIVNINDNGTEVIKGTKIDIDGTNLGVKLTEITNQQNDHSQKINNNTASIQANENKINLKVDTQTYEQDKNDMTQSVNKNTADITLLNNQIALKVEATDIKNAINQYDNTVNTKIDQAKAEIKVTTDGIKQSVTGLQTTTNGLSTTVNSHTAEMNAMKNQINLKVEKTDIDTAIKDLKLGGKNLLRYSKLDTNDANDGWVEFKGNSGDGLFGTKYKHLQNANASNTYTDMLRQIVYKPNNVKKYIKPNTWYTLSFYSKGTGKVRTHVFPSLIDTSIKGYCDDAAEMLVSDGNKDWNLANDWARHTYTFKTKSSIPSSEQNILFRLYGGNEVYICATQLEEGNKVSDWSVNVEDIEDNTDTKINQAKAEIKVTTDGITQSVTNVQSQVNTANGNISNLQTQTSQIQQTANKIHWLVKDGTNQANMQLTSNGLNVIADAINLDGLVKFTNLSTQGQTTINGGNITTGTIDTNRVNIKGSTTKKIVIGNDNYTVYDGAETDTNRKIFMGFRTNTAINVPSVMLGYNGINPSVDGAVISGGTYTTYSHYPNNNNPEAVNLSYGALAFKYGAGTNQFSTFNMYQNGSIDIKGGSRISFRPNLRDRSNPAFYIDDVETMSRVPLKCTQSIYANGEITTDTNITCRDLLLFNRIKNISNSFYVSNAGAVGTASINNDGVLTQEGIGHFYSGIQGWNGIGSSSNTWTITQGGHAFFTGVNYFYNSNNINSLTNSQDALDVIDSIEVVDTNEGYRLTKNPKSKDAKIARCVTLDDEDNVAIDLTESISVLWKAVQELKQENLELKKRIETLERP